MLDLLKQKILCEKVNFMALKDWKKEGDRYLESKLRTESNLPKWGISVFKQNNSDSWDVYINMSGTVGTTKTFKTKQQALRFARAYMTSH